jgi:hypothetical protein
MDPLWRHFYIVVYEVSWKQWELYEEVEDAKYSPGGYFQFRHEFRHLERRPAQMRQSALRIASNVQQVTAQCGVCLSSFLTSFSFQQRTWKWFLQTDAVYISFYHILTMTTIHSFTWINYAYLLPTLLSTVHTPLNLSYFYSKSIRLLLSQIKPISLMVSTA